MNDYQEKVNEFLKKSKNYLASYFYKENKHGIHLKDVYPSIFENCSLVDIGTKRIEDTIEFYYDDILPKNLRKDYGQFYTKDSNLIKSIINKLNLLEGKILEPSCGSGLFLVAIANNIIKKLSKKETSENILIYLIENIYGNDIDLNACQLTEINLLTCIMPLIVDAINNNPSFKMEKFNITNKDFITDYSYFNGFSIVVGNPPYVTMYGKRSRNMTEEKRKIFNTFDFVQNKNGNNKFNLAMFFVENGMKVLKRNGKLIYILDISFFETAFIDLRKYLLENYKIKSITSGLQEFEAVASGQLLLDVENINEINEKVEWIDYSTSAITLVNQKNWLDDSPKYRINKPLDGIQNQICKKINMYPKLDFYYPSKCLRTCCALTGKTEEFIVDPLKEKEHTVFPFLEGSKGLSEKFGSFTPTCYIKYDYELQIKLSDEFKVELEALGVKNKKRVTLGDKEAYLAPKLFIRQSATELIVSYTESPLASNNSMYILTNKLYDDESKKMLKYICAIMNSDLMTFYSRVNKIIRIEKGKTPQIKISDLKELRIKLDENRFEEVVRLVESIYETKENYETILANINDLVYKMYGINEKEKEFIKEYLKK